MSCLFLLMVLCRFGLFSLSPGLMHRFIRMVGWSIYGIQLQLFALRGIDYIMVCARGHYYRLAIFNHMLFLSSENKGCFSLLNAEELVHFGAHFIAYFFTGLQAHHHQLSILACK